MTLKKMYYSIRTATFVGSLSVFGGAFYAFVIAGICRIVFTLEENMALTWIGGPTFFAFTTWGFIYLPRHLRKSGLIE